MKIGDINLNKTIIIYASVNDIKNKSRIIYTLKEFEEAIKRQDKIIETTQFHALSSKYFEKGYDIFIISEGKQIKMSDILRIEKAPFTYGREIRLAHNWEKMFHSGVFNIPYSWEF